MRYFLFVLATVQAFFSVTIAAPYWDGDQADKYMLEARAKATITSAASVTGTALASATTTTSRPTPTPTYYCDEDVPGVVEWFRATDWLVKKNIEEFCEHKFVESYGTGTKKFITSSEELNKGLDAHVKVGAAIFSTAVVTKQNCKDWNLKLLEKCQYGIDGLPDKYFAGGRMTDDLFALGWTFYSKNS